MKTNKQWAAALCIIAMAGCATDRMNDTSSVGYSSSDASTSASTSPSGAGSTSSSGSGTAAGSSPATPMTGSTAQTSYGVVQAIDQMQRQDVGVGAMGAVGAAAAGGSAAGGTGMPTDKVYRVTVRMDDGSSQMVVVESMPSYSIGDRVRYSNGSIVAY